MAKKIPKAERSDIISGWSFNYKFMEKITEECRNKDNGDVYQEMVDSVLSALHRGGYIEVEAEEAPEIFDGTKSALDKLSIKG